MKPNPGHSTVHMQTTDYQKSDTNLQLLTAKRQLTSSKYQLPKTSFQFQFTNYQKSAPTTDYQKSAPSTGYQKSVNQFQLPVTKNQFPYASTDCQKSANHSNYQLPASIFHLSSTSYQSPAPSSTCLGCLQSFVLIHLDPAVGDLLSDLLWLLACSSPVINLLITAAISSSIVIKLYIRCGRVGGWIFLTRMQLVQQVARFSIVRPSLYSILW